MLQRDEFKPLFRLPANAKLILELIEREGPQTQKELAEKLTLTLRALRYALNRCELRGVLVKKANLADMRSLFYTINEQIVGADLSVFIQEEGLAEA